MIQSKYEWQYDLIDTSLVEQLAKELHVPTLVAKVLVARGVTTEEEAKALMEVDASMMHDPFLMYGMEEAVELIHMAIETETPILVYGDYDADGVTSTTVLLRALRSLGAVVDYAIPNRFLHGYGPNATLFEEKIYEGFELIITVDNGVSGHEAIERAKALGATVIVTDHHEFGETLPPADVIIHPRHPEGQYPFGELAGVGVAFKVATALLGEVDASLLQFVALGTVADLVPLVDENRYFVKRGMELMRTDPAVGVRALADVSGVALLDIVEDSLGFSFGPRLNAPGRLQEAGIAVDLLMAEDGREAAAFALQLNEMNVERQQLVQQMTEEAVAIVEAMPTVPLVLVIAKEGWNPGVVGIVASRLTERYYRPSIVLGIDEASGEAKGSARSIEGFHLFQQLQRCEPLIEKYGGHAMAAGLTVPIDSIDALRDRLNEEAADQLTPELLRPRLQIDVKIESQDIGLETLQLLDTLRPYGVGFAKPVYAIEDVRAVDIRQIGASRNHLKMQVERDGVLLDCVGFHQGDTFYALNKGSTVSLVGDLQINEWNGRQSPQLLIEDLACHERQLFDLRGMRRAEQWQSSIPEEAVYVLFHAEAHRHFPTVTDWQEASAVTNRAESLVLLDLPSSLDEVRQLIERTEASRVYCHFFVEHPVYLEPLPTRDMFEWLFKAIQQRGHFDFKKEKHFILQHKGWKEETLVFILQVFLDLQFVKLEGSVFTIAPSLQRRELTEAPSYVRRVQQSELERQLLYSSYEQLKQLLI